ncbi:MAG: hypothetical protein R2911_16590 [Caldilineaceae bacterium]
MNAIRTIVQNDLKIYFSQMGNLIGLIILPIVFTLVLGWAFGGAGNEGPRGCAPMCWMKMERPHRRRF